MDEIVELVRRIGRQQGRNAYYRVCYCLLKEMQERIKHILHRRLHFLYTEDTIPRLNSNTVIAIALDLHDATKSIRLRQKKAFLDWKGTF
jgi:hypothetical protein